MTADALTAAVADRLAMFCGQVLGAPTDALQAISDLCADAITATLPSALPGVTAADILATLVAQSDGAVTAQSIDAAMQQAFAMVMPVVANAGIGPPPAGAGGASPSSTAGAGGTPPTSPGPDEALAALASLEPLATSAEATAVASYGKVEIAKYYFQLWGNIPGTTRWDEIGPEFGSAAVIEGLAPLVSRALSSCGLKEVVPTTKIGQRVHERIQTSYRLRHPENFVIVDAEVYQGETNYGDLRQPPVRTWVPQIDTELILAQFAYGFAKPLFDVSAAGANTYESRMFRPDILDLSSGKVFEIKPIRSAKSAVAQLWAYQAFINAALTSDTKTFTPIKRGWWELPIAVFPINDAQALWAFAFMFPGLGPLVAVPGVIFYIVFMAEEVVYEAAALAAVLVQIVRSALTSNAPSIPEDQAPQPEIEDPGSDSWAPNGEDPFEDEPTDDNQDSDEPPWDTPSPPASASAQTGSDEASTTFVQDHLVAILIIAALVIIALVIIAIIAFGPEIAIILAAIVTFLGWILEEGLVVGAAAALVVIIVKALLANPGQLASTTSAALGASADQAWATVTAQLSSLTSLTPDDFSKLDIPIAPTTGAATG